MGTSELKGIVSGAAIGRRALLAAAMTAAGLGITDLAAGRAATTVTTEIDIGKMYRIRSAPSSPENPDDAGHLQGASKRAHMGPLLESSLISEITRSLVVAGRLFGFSLLLEPRKSVLQCRCARRIFRGLLL